MDEIKWINLHSGVLFLKRDSWRTVEVDDYKSRSTQWNSPRKHPCEYNSTKNCPIDSLWTCKQSQIWVYRLESQTKLISRFKNDQISWITLLSANYDVQNRLCKKSERHDKRWVLHTYTQPHDTSTADVINAVGVLSHWSCVCRYQQKSKQIFAFYHPNWSRNMKYMLHVRTNLNNDIDDFMGRQQHKIWSISAEPNKIQENC